MSGMKSDWIHEPITVHDSKQVGPIGDLTHKQIWLFVC